MARPSDRATRASHRAPTGLDHSAGIPRAVGNIHFIERPGMSASEQRLSMKYLTLLTRVYRYRRAGNFALSCAAGEAADVVAARIANLSSERKAA